MAKGKMKVIDLTGEVNDDWLKALPAGKEEKKIHADLAKKQAAKKKRRPKNRS